jgi:putative transposase
MKLLESTLQSTPISRPIPTDERPQGLCLDRGYDYDAVRELAVAQRFEPHIRTRGEEIAAKVRDPTWRPRRWVVEAAHSWLNRTAPSPSAGRRRTRTTSPSSNSPAG